MLFQRLYNWIKYKTLPPSFLFKNRLFVERDSKHKKIVSNFGSTFRNSKWGDHENTNVRPQLKISYFKLFLKIILFFFIFLIVLKYTNYYLYCGVFNFISFIFWLSADAVDYYTSFIIWFGTIFFTFCSNLIYSYLFNNFFSEKEIEDLKKKIESYNIFKDISFPTKAEIKSLLPSKSDINWLLYSWLSNKNGEKREGLLRRFYNMSRAEKWELTCKFFKFLNFLLFYPIFGDPFAAQRHSAQQMVDTYNKWRNGDYDETIAYFMSFLNVKKLYVLISEFFTNIYKNYFVYYFKKFRGKQRTDTKKEWNFYDFVQEIENNPNLVKFKTGPFFFDQFSSNKFNDFIINFKEFKTLNLVFKNQTDAAKWNRWLYRYSVLHRKNIKNSHKLTSAKRLLNVNSFDSQMFDKNIWANAYLNKAQAWDKLPYLFKNYYRGLFDDLTTYSSIRQKSTGININKKKTQLNLLNFYENSYFWFNKRFYEFNTLPENFIKTGVKLNKKFINISVEGQNVIFYKFMLGSFFKNLVNLNTSFAHFNFSCFSDSNFFFKSISNDSNLKDLFIFIGTNNFFFKENLNSAYRFATTFNYFNSLMFSDYHSLNLYNFYSANRILYSKLFYFFDPCFACSNLYANAGFRYLHDLVHASFFS